MCRAVSLAPSSPDILCHRGRLALFLKYTETAQRDFAAALKLDPRCCAALSGLARGHLLQGEFDEAEAQADRALRIDPADEDAAQVKVEIQAACRNARSLALDSMPAQSTPATSLLLPNHSPGCNTDKHYPRVTLISNGHPLREISVKSLVGYLEANGVSCRSVYLDSATQLTPTQNQQVLDLCAGSTIVGFSLMSKDVKTFRPISDALKNAGTPVIWGGIHPTAMPEDALNHCDFACVGEGELTLLRLYYYLLEGKTDYSSIPNLAYTKNGQQILPQNFHSEPSLDALPFPDYRFSDAHMLRWDGRLHDIPSSPNLREPFLGMSTFLFYSQRGCPLSCSYCSNSLYHTLATKTKVRWYRTASPARIKSEIRHHLQFLTVRDMVWLNDDDFISRPLEELDEVGKFFRDELGLRYNINATPSGVSQEKMAVLVKYGLGQIAMGVQTGSVRILKDVYRRRVMPDQVLKAAHIISQFYKDGIVADYGFILDNPYEQPDDWRDSIKLFRALPKPFTVSLYSLSFFPGTNLTVKALNENVIRADQISLDKDYRETITPSFVHMLFEANFNWDIPEKFSEWLLSDDVLRSAAHEYSRLLLSNYFLSDALNRLVALGPDEFSLEVPQGIGGSPSQVEVEAFTCTVKQILKHWSAPSHVYKPSGPSEDLVLQYATTLGQGANDKVEIGFSNGRIVRVGDSSFAPVPPANALTASYRQKHSPPAPTNRGEDQARVQSELPSEKKAHSVAHQAQESSWTFGIVTNGQRETWVDDLIQSILNQNIPDFEIVVCGRYPNAQRNNVKNVLFDGDEARGWITKKKNLIISHATKENICLLHDRMRLHPQWYEGQKRFGNNFQFQYCRVASLDQAEEHNSAMAAFVDAGKILMCNLPGGMRRDGMWIDGAQIIAKTNHLRYNLLNEQHLIAEGEDVEWSRRVMRKGYEINYNPYSLLLNRAERKVHRDYREPMRVVTHPSADPALFREMLVSASESWGYGKRSQAEILLADRNIASVPDRLFLEIEMMRALASREPYFALWYGLALQQRNQPGRALEQFEAAARLGLNDWRLQSYITALRGNGLALQEGDDHRPSATFSAGNGNPTIFPANDPWSWGGCSSGGGRIDGSDDATSHMTTTSPTAYGDFPTQWKRMQDVYHELLRHMESDGTDRWDPAFVHPHWKDACHAIMNVLDGVPNSNLLANPVIARTMVRQGFTVSQEYEVTYIKHCLRRQTYDKLMSYREPAFGNLEMTCPELRCSTNTLGHLFYAAKASELFACEQFNVIVEFGGGYGNLAWVLKHLHPRATVVVLDLPEFLAVQYLFLSSICENVRVVLHARRDVTIQHGAINLVPVFYCDGLQLNADLFISTFALSETPASMQQRIWGNGFFNARNVYLAGQLVGASKDVPWVDQTNLFTNIRKQFARVQCVPFHVFQNGVKLYEIAASARLVGAEPERRGDVVVKLQGGLGNQMFQYAAGLALARRAGAKLKLDLGFLLDRTPRPNFTFRDYDLDLFNLAPDCGVVNYGISGSESGLPPFKEKHFHYDRDFETLGAGTYLDGHWQSPRYFKAVGEEVCRTFTSFRAPLNSEQQALADRIRSSNAVCLDVRRGDYVSNPASVAVVGVCYEDYYETAVRYFLKRFPDAHFFVFSDDIEWCRKAELVKGAPCTFVTDDYAGDRFGGKLQLMIGCRHFIIPNSTWGWWAAFLSESPDKTVIAPSPWLNDVAREFADLLPSDWILLSRTPGPTLVDLKAPAVVSVVLTCCDQACHLREAVESVVSQTFGDWELLIVSDSRLNFTARVAGEIVDLHPERRIRLIEMATDGLAAARNSGIGESRGRYILPIDADDKLAPEYMAKTVAFLDAHTNVAIVGTHGHDIGLVNRVVPASEYTLATIIEDNHVNYCSLYRREVWQAVGGYNPAKDAAGSEDWDFWVKCAERGWLAQCLPEPLFVQRVTSARPQAVAPKAPAAVAPQKPIESEEISHQRAEALCRSFHWAEASHVYRMLTVRLPDELAGWRGRVECARQQGHAVMVDIIVEEALERHPEWATALNEAGTHEAVCR